MKVGIFGLVSILGLGAHGAWADCDDTVYLQKIVVYQQSLKNDTALKTWDISEVNPWNMTELVNAGPIGFSYMNDGADTALHLMRFQYNCGSDSVSSTLYGRVVDSLRIKGEGFSRVRYADTVRQVAKSKMNNGKGSGVSMSFNGGVINYDVLWDIGDEQIGKLAASVIRQSWSSNFISYSYQKQTGGLSYSRLASPRMVRPARVISDDDLRSYLEDVQISVAKVGANLDSVRTKVRLFQYVYDNTQPVASTMKKSASPSIDLFTDGNLYFLNMMEPQPVAIVSPSGRVVRRLDAARNVVWDLRDQAGVRVQPGVWFVQVQGLKTVPVVVR